MLAKTWPRLAVGADANSIVVDTTAPLYLDLILLSWGAVLNAADDDKAWGGDGHNLTVSMSDAKDR